MSGKTLRRVFKIGRSRAITLPPDWDVEVGDRVILLFNRHLLVINSRYSSDAEEAIEKAIQNIVSADGDEKKAQSLHPR